MQTPDRRATGLVTSGPAQATLLTGLTLVTSSTAHVEGGGLLPGGPGLSMLLVAAALGWCLCTVLSRTRVGVLLALALGQAGSHACHGIEAEASGGGMSPETLMSTGDGTLLVGTMEGIGVLPGASMTAGSMTPGSMAMHGMHGAHPVAAMWLCHLVAVLASAALVLALRLPTALQSWLSRTMPTVPGIGPVVTRRTPVWPRRRCIPLWAPTPPPLRRGPPLTA